MSSERIKLQGRRAELKEELQELDYRADNHISTIRDLIDPFTNFTELETDRAKQAMTSLDIIVKRAKEVKKQIAQISAELGD